MRRSLRAQSGHLASSEADDRVSSITSVSRANARAPPFTREEASLDDKVSAAAYSRDTAWGMSEENVEIVQRAIAAVNNRDLKAISRSALQMSS
jgi:hypothetical protein